MYRLQLSDQVSLLLHVKKKSKIPNKAECNQDIFILMKFMQIMDSANAHKQTIL